MYNTNIFSGDWVEMKPLADSTSASRPCDLQVSSESLRTTTHTNTVAKKQEEETGKALLVVLEAAVHYIKLRSMNQFFFLMYKL